MAPALNWTPSRAASGIPSPEQSTEVHQTPLRTGGFMGQSLRLEHQRLVFTDLIAFRYLEDDPSTIVLKRRTNLQGYEIYIVEQWACSREHPTFVITTYTGDPSHTVVVGILGVPTDENAWSLRLKQYFHGVAQYHARKKDTPLGNLMVTNLNAFPSALTVIPVSDGNITARRDDFIVNEDLKRLGCSGRAGLKLQYPSAVVKAKFYQLYRISENERVPLYTAVVELVRQCQVALTIFGKLTPEYADGLLCDVTERAISDWWTDVGTDFYNIEPSDGILGPTTVAALLGMLMGARNRLHASGAPVPKDVFDISSLKKGIGSFQKSQKISRTRRLDRQTLDKLHRVTAKAACSEGWTGAVKSTVVELSGKGGEMVMGMVGGRDKGGIAGIETLDIDLFVQLVTSERSKWLWRGKPLKPGLMADLESMAKADTIVSTRDNHGRSVWPGRKRHSANLESPANRTLPEPDFFRRHADSTASFDDRDQHRGKAVAKNLTGKVSDARSGFEKFRGAVGLPSLRAHHHKHAKDNIDLGSEPSFNTTLDSDAETQNLGSTILHTSNLAEGEDGRGKGLQNRVDRLELTSAAPSGKPTRITGKTNPQPESSHEAPMMPFGTTMYGGLKLPFIQQDNMNHELDLSDRSRSTEAPTNREQLPGITMKTLRRPQSFPDLISGTRSNQKEACFLHRLSFSAVEEVVLAWEDLSAEKPPAVMSDSNADLNLQSELVKEDSIFSNLQVLNSRALAISNEIVPWVQRHVGSIEGLHRKATTLGDELNLLCLECINHYQSLRERSSNMLTEESSYLADGLKRAELLGAKLDYELTVLESKVEDVEDGVEEFERHVIELETRIEDLVRNEEERDGSWFSWAKSLFSRTQ